MLKYTKRNGFMAGLTVAQISEFSLILVALGVRVGHVSIEILSMVTTIGLLTIFGSTYMITHSNKLYLHLSRYLGIFERRGKKVDEHVYHKGEHYHILLFGYDRMALSLLESVKKLKKKFLIIDYDPEKIAELAGEGYECRYGDANDMEFLNELNFSKAKMIISTIPDTEANLLLIKRVRESNKKAIIIVVSHQIEGAMKLYESGATYVLMPYFLGGECASTLIEKYGMNLNDFLKEKAMHISHLKIRGELRHEHPKHQKHK
jgi:hypothetical protein